MIETTDNHKTIIRDSLADADLFARGILRVPLHDWQGARLYGASKLGDCPTWRDHDHLIVTPTGGRLTAFVTDESSRAEGYHERKPDGPLLMIINEAREVHDEIFKAFNRCSYNLLLVISTGGLMQGKFYDAFTKDGRVTKPTQLPGTIARIYRQKRRLRRLQTVMGTKTTPTMCPRFLVASCGPMTRFAISLSYRTSRVIDKRISDESQVLFLRESTSLLEEITML